MLRCSSYVSMPAAAASSSALPLPPDASTAVITGIQELSPTVRALQLHIENDSKEGRGAFRFRAGQWVDFFVPGLDKVGGFSMVSTPEDLPVLRLAVKKADFAPPARWVHHEAQVRRSVRRLCCLMMECANVLMLHDRRAAP